jgi:catechol 2,3-dioxygenase-like lactoylglutathione lyase family enzyme
MLDVGLELVVLKVALPVLVDVGLVWNPATARVMTRTRASTAAPIPITYDVFMVCSMESGEEKGPRGTSVPTQFGTQFQPWNGWEALFKRLGKLITSNSHPKSMLDKARLVTFVTVKKMDRAIKFYTDALGGKLVMEGEGDMKGSWASVKVGKNEFWLIKPSEWEKRELAYNAFLVEDIDAAVADLKKKGVKFNRAEKYDKDTKIDGPIARHTWAAEAFFKDSEGNLLMVWQSV